MLMLELRKGMGTKLPVTLAFSLAQAQREQQERKGNEVDEEIVRVLPIGKCRKRRKREKR
jgi:hypothetical protein